MIVSIFFAIYVQIQFKNYLVINNIKKISNKIKIINDENIQFKKDIYQKKTDHQWLKKKIFKERI